jgi:UDP-N-acetylmuramoyl-L-alanyl-D-glutamate--2,6-diaminopimelate ligase
MTSATTSAQATLRLSDLIGDLPDAHVVAGDPEVVVREVRDDSRRVEPGDLFVAVTGTVADGRGYLADAAARGARVLVVEAGTSAPPGYGGTVVAVPAARRALGLLAARRFGAAASLTLSAVTGTNGKTTTTYLVEAMLEAAGVRAGVIGTIAYRVGGGAAPAVSRRAPLTTPGALALHEVMAEMRAAGATDVVLEATSHALDQGRLDGCRFRVAALTNVTQDHLDYHGTMERYFDAKAVLFERLLDETSGVAVLPLDRAEGRAMRARLGGRRQVWGVASSVAGAGAGSGAGVEVAVESARITADGTVARLATPRGPLEIDSPLVGDYNLANLVLAAGMGLARGLDPGAVAAGVAALRGVPGRLEAVANDRGVLCVVDYAHTPDALERAMAAVRPLVAPGGRLITVFGCGGDRDRTKRPLMGRAAARDSDLSIVTSDNPRTEDPESIIAMIVEGARREQPPELGAEELAAAGARGVHVVTDRRVAIRRAGAAARAGDVLLIAGKGHEDYQIVGTTRLHFDDREEARAALGEAPA